MRHCDCHVITGLFAYLYMIHPFSCHIIYSHVHTIAHNTERQQLHAVSGSLKSGFLRVFYFKNLKFGLLRFLVFL